MTVSAKRLIDSINAKLALEGAPSADNLARLAEAARELESVYSVATLADLPPAENNRGRMIYVRSVDGHRYSDGIEWTEDFRTIPRGVFRIWSWGCNGQGQLGHDTATTCSRSSPVSVVGGFTDWCAISAGCSHSLALRSNGTLWSWGLNFSGQLGDGTTTSRSSPVSVVGGFTDWCRIAGGLEHSVAIRANGTLWSWGWNISGRLGDGTTTDRSSPVSVVGGFTDWSQIAAGRYHSLALRTDGTLWSWGCNFGGRLGDGTATDRSSPVSVVGGFTDWSQISAGRYHSLALRSDGTLWSWGQNCFGMLAHNTADTCSRSSPVSVIGGFTDWSAISAGLRHNLALRANGTVWSWGSNGNGQLGDGTITDRSSPVSVVGGFTDWCGISAGNRHSLAIRSNGTLWSWGSNFYGQLGHNTCCACSRNSPVSVIGGFADWCRISAKGNHSLAIKSVTGF